MFACFPAATGENVEITIAWDPSFMKTIPGRLKLGAIVSLLLPFILLDRFFYFVVGPRGLNCL